MDKKEHTALQRKVEFYNMIPNLVWSVIFITPIFIFFYQNINLKWILIFAAIYFSSVFLPNFFFRFFQMGKSVSIYKKCGVVFISRFTQNGAIVNKIIRKKYPNYKTVSAKNNTIEKVFRRTFMFEKFHFMMFLFFFFASAYALVHAFFGWALFITFANVAFNVYPMFLQQYIRLRLSSLNRHKRQ
jgi:hypothetical protein